MLRDVPLIYTPDLPVLTSTAGITPAITTTSLKQALCWRASRTGNVAKVGSRWGTVSGSNTATFSLQNCVSNGAPDGVNDQTANTLTPASNTDFEADFSLSPRPVVVNEAVAMVVGGSVVGGSFQLMTNGIAFEQNSVWTSAFNGSAWANGGGSPSLYVQYSDGVIVPIAGVFPGFRVSQNFATNTNPNECGLRFRLNVPCRLAGLRLYFTSGFAAVFDIKAYADNLTLLGTGTRGVTRGAGSPIDTYYETPIVLSAGVWYRVSILPTSTSAVLIPFFDAASSTTMNAAPGGTNIHWFTRNGGAATDITTRRPSLSLIIDQLDDGITSPTDVSVETLIVHGDQSMM